ncbi:MAG: hypothetical protein AAGF27_12175 [Pseudomonadota bacterium]
MTSFTPGDLVEFDVREEGDMRIALRPSIVAQGHYESLTSDLVNATKRRKTGNDTKGYVTCEVHNSPQVVPFPDVSGHCSCVNTPQTARGLKAS